jgi:energy-coupling factor transport system ATP-binding protein
MERAGFVFQNAASQLLASSVADEVLFGLENLGLSQGEMMTRLQGALARFGLESLASRPPRTLSGGEQQRLALAATLARRPHVLVLDEPLSMLDATSAAQLVRDLTALARDGTAVVICEHRREYLDPVQGLSTLELGAGDWGVGEATRFDTTPFCSVPPFEVRIEHLGVELGGQTVLADLDLSLSGGQVVAIVGRNGVGKTTLLRAVAGLQRYTGTVTVGDRPPQLTMVSQNPDLQLFNPTVREEILYGTDDVDRARYEWLLRVLGLSRYAAASPLLLSEGEKKRVALATALMSAPRDGVLLDEPSLGQDSVHKAYLMHLARALADTGRVVVMTTHDLTLALQAERLVLLGHDGVLADGAPRDTLQQTVAWRRAGLVVPEWIASQVGEVSLAA